MRNFLILALFLSASGCEAGGLTTEQIYNKGEESERVSEYRKEQGRKDMADTIAESCDKIGSFYVGNRAYKCERIKPKEAK